MKGFFIYVFLAFLLSSAQAETSKETWMSVLLDGQKIGYTHSTREVKENRVLSMQRMEIALERAGIVIALSMEEKCEETKEGKPLSFQARSKLSGIETIASGIVRNNGKMEIITEMAGIKQTRTIPWPKDALLAEGLRLAALEVGLKPGTRFTTVAFESSSQQGMSVTSTVKGQEWVDLPDGLRQLHRVEQDISLSGVPTHSRAWVDDEQNVHKVIMSLLGFNLTLINCQQTCALAPNQSANVFEHALLHSPRGLNHEELAQGLRFYFQRTKEGEPLVFAHTDEQLVFAHTDEQQVKHLSDGRVEVIISMRSIAKRQISQGKPQAMDFQATDWLQSKESEVERLAKQAVGDAQSTLEKMQHLEKFVRQYIHKKNLTVGYASALEVARSQEGDCTEHALLLAAMGRSLGIATRVVNGLAYTDKFNEAQHVFVPHAWIQAWVNGRWQSFDAALNGFDAGHIAWSVGNGDPWRFYVGLNTLGNLRLLDVETVSSAK